jgi:hypothetical protein
MQGEAIRIRKTRREGTRLPKGDLKGVIRLLLLEPRGSTPREVILKLHNNSLHNSRPEDTPRLRRRLKPLKVTGSPLKGDIPNLNNLNNLNNLSSLSPREGTEGMGRTR